jgi:hypothetical protein
MGPAAKKRGGAILVGVRKIYPTVAIKVAKAIATSMEPSR